MTKSIPTLAAAFLMTAIATPVFAQAAIQEPGAFAFYHPNADVLGYNPAAPPDGQHDPPAEHPRQRQARRCERDRWRGAAHALPARHPDTPSRRLPGRRRSSSAISCGAAMPGR